MELAGIPEMSLRGGALILAAALIRVLCRDRLPARLMPTVWCAALARLLLPVTCALPRGALTAAARALTEPSPLPAIVSQAAGVSPGAAVGAAASGGVGFPALRVLWAAVALGLWLWFLIPALRLRRELRAALPVEGEFAARWLNRHRLRRRVELREFPGLPTPLTLGVIRPVILVPAGFDWTNTRRAGYILSHELAHIRHLDAVWKVLSALALCLHWFNPAVWLMYALFGRDMELSCDEQVLLEYGRGVRADYAGSLIELEARRRGPSPFGSCFSFNAAEERIRSIMKITKKSTVALVLALALATAGTVMAFAAPNSSGAGFADIIRGGGSFTLITPQGRRELTLSQVPALFDPDDEYMRVWDLALVDLDGDGGEEAVLNILGVSGDTGGKLILHRAGGEILGYTVDSRTLFELKADGTGSFTDPTGLGEMGVCTVTFTADGVLLNRTVYATGAPAGWETFTVDGLPSGEEEFMAALQAQSEKPDAVWYGIGE